MITFQNLQNQFIFYTLELYEIIKIGVSMILMVHWILKIFRKSFFRYFLQPRFDFSRVRI